MGLSQFERRTEYYTYLLEHYTTTNLTADEIHNLGLQELERIHTEMQVIFDQLGYPENDDLVTLSSAPHETVGSSLPVRLSIPMNRLLPIPTCS